MACRVPGARMRCRGTVNVSRVPCSVTRRSLAWLPRVETTSKPNSPSARRTSRAESRLSFGGIRSHRHLVRHQKAGCGDETERSMILALEMEGNRLLEVRQHLVGRSTLGDHCHLETLRDEVLPVTVQHRMDRIAQAVQTSASEGRRALGGPIDVWTGTRAGPVRLRDL